MRSQIFAVACLVPTLACAQEAAAPWQGFYIGANLGHALGRLGSNFTLPDTFTGTAGSSPQADGALAALPVATQATSDSGFIGGVQSGYNRQFGGYVAGVELDFSSMNLSGSSTVVGFSDPIHLWSDTVETSFDTDWLFSLRPRIGFTLGSTFFYATAGLAVTRLTLSQTQTSVDLLAGVPGYSEHVSEEKTKVGWTIGGGVEVALGQNWTLKGEYLRTDFGHIKLKGLTEGPSAYTGLGILGDTFAHDFELRTSVVRGGLNYHF